MARISYNMQIINLDTDVLIIKYPGEEREEVLHRFSEGWNRFTVGKYISQIKNDTRFGQEERGRALFWLGYFYRSLASV